MKDHLKVIGIMVGALAACAALVYGLIMLVNTIGFAYTICIFMSYGLIGIYEGILEEVKLGPKGFKHYYADRLENSKEQK